MPLPVRLDTRTVNGDMTPVIGGHPVPSFLLKPIPPLACGHGDDLSKRIATLFALHPSLRVKHSASGLDSMTTDGKLALLAAINADLGIRPTRRTLDLIRD